MKQCAISAGLFEHSESARRTNGRRTVIDVDILFKPEYRFQAKISKIFAVGKHGDGALAHA
jgi:hypothetical protein